MKYYSVSQRDQLSIIFHNICMGYIIARILTTISI